MSLAFMIYSAVTIHSVVIFYKENLIFTYTQVSELSNPIMITYDVSCIVIQDSEQYYSSLSEYVKLT